jgi:hypothetical protein
MKTSPESQQTLVIEKESNFYQLEAQWVAD